MSRSLELSDQMRKHMRRCMLHEHPQTIIEDEHLSALVIYMAFSCSDVSREEVAAVMRACADTSKPYVVSLSGNTLMCSPVSIV